MFEVLESGNQPNLEAAATPKGTKGATVLPPQPTPKAGKQVGLPSYLTSANPPKTPLVQTDRRLAATDITTLRGGTSTQKIIGDFVAASPDLSAAVFAYIRTAITKSFTAVAKNTDGTFNVDATSLLQQIISRMDVVPNYANGYAGNYSLRSVSESLALELVSYGGMSCELVLDKARLPWRIQPLSVTHIKWVPDGPGDIIPQQEIAGQKIDLDIPTFFYTALDQSLLTPYASSMLEPAIKPVIFSEEFNKDIQRVVKRSVHPRQIYSVNEEKFRKFIPMEVLNDPEKLAAYQNTFMEALTSQVNGLNPEDAVILFDTIGFEFGNNGNISLSDEYKTLSDIANAKLATGAKTLPAILGHGTGSQNIASTESMLFVKSVSGGVQEKLNEIFSRVFTLAVRLFGYDVVVDFKYAPINLRPEDELESFKAMAQSRVLELLSLGLITDEEASIQLTGRMPPQGYKPLSGTMFKSASAQGVSANPDGQSNGGSALNQNLNSGSESGGARGSNTKKNPVKAEGESPELEASQPPSRLHVV